MNSLGASRSFRNHYHDPAPILNQVTRYGVKLFARFQSHGNGTKPHRWRLRSILRAELILVVLWLYVLYWGERTVYSKSVARCDWRFWEDWPQGARPHRLMLVADPQLVDPHTYPGRPWPLSTLTMGYTDLYLSRVFRKSMHALEPQTTFFLGDLFDGGREWSTGASESPEEQWHKYGGEYWLKEYDRFSNIFFKPWAEWQAQLDGNQGEHKLITSLPGNHDLGFAAGVQMPVRKRFNAYFGEGNRIDIIGNHTFVSLDTVSLSAMETSSPADIWAPAVAFLDENKKARSRAIGQQMRLLHGANAFPKYTHEVIEQNDLPNAKLPSLDENAHELPTILFTHVPLWRDPGTPCGPLREHWPPSPPPSSQEGPLIKDDRNAIAVARGYQYQNVLTQPVTRKILDTLGVVQYAFSGDDHDYCDVTHHGYSGLGDSIREITVKSLSLAMGVRNPGFVQVSLWNPVDVHGKSISDNQDLTLKTNLCLLPDALGILLRYALVLSLTLAILIARATIITLYPAKSNLQSTGDGPLLPLVRSDEKAKSPEVEDREFDFSRPCDASANSSTLQPLGTSLSMRPPRTRSSSPAVDSSLNFTSIPANGTAKAAGDYSLPLIAHAGYYGPPEGTNGPPTRVFGRLKPKKAKRPQTGWRLGVGELQRSLIRVGAVALLWYWWLLRTA